MTTFLSGYNFAQFSDVIFAEHFVSENIDKIYGGNSIQSNDIVFCKTDFISNFFDFLKNNTHLKNLKLITHESDYPITEKRFLDKPENIIKWYAINVDYEHEDLIPIPLGIGNDHSIITLKITNLKECKHNPFKLLYVNHRIWTNRSSRGWIYDYFSNIDWCTVRKPNLTFDEYVKDLNEHKFMLCPIGNGIDTHRLWECIYHKGIIPVIESHINYKMCEHYPVLIVDSFKDLTEDFLEEKYIEIKNKKYDSEKLCVEYIIDKMKNAENWF